MGGAGIIRTCLKRNWWTNSAYVHPLIVGAGTPLFTAPIARARPARVEALPDARVRLVYGIA